MCRNVCVVVYPAGTPISRDREGLSGARLHSSPPNGYNAAPPTSEKAGALYHDRPVEATEKTRTLPGRVRPSL